MPARRRAPHRARTVVWLLLPLLAGVAVAAGTPAFVEASGLAIGVLSIGLVLDRVARRRETRRVRRTARREGVERSLMRLSGAEFERVCAEALRARGARVIEQGGGGDQGADLLVDWAGRRYAVQCKRYKSNVGNAAVQQVHAARGYYRTDGAIVMTNRRFTRAARTLAARLDVVLIDRDGLTRVLT